jgi:tRNA(Leu) C34 or U34 (ribose-2'-O)-methylase TrmL
MLWFWKQVHGVSQEQLPYVMVVLKSLNWHKHSLNIAVSAGIVVWDLFKQFNN